MFTMLRVIHTHKKGKKPSFLPLQHKYPLTTNHRVALYTQEIRYFKYRAWPCVCFTAILGEGI